MVAGEAVRRLSGVVMCHPARAVHAAQVAESVGHGLVDVVMDPEPDGPPTALRTTIRAWESVGHGATHHLVLHDDMVPSARLWADARTAIDAYPDAALALCAFWNSRNGAAARLGVLSGHRWVTAVNEYTPCIALILPADVAAGFGAFARAAGDAWPEDVLMYRYLKSRGVSTYVAAPSLAEHQDLRSLSGNDFHGVRRAACLVPDDLPVPSAASVGHLDVVPFFKHGLAQCAVRLPTQGTPRWENISTERYLTRIGHQVADVYASLDSYRRQTRWAPRRPDSAADAAIAGAWLTAYAMGVVNPRPSEAPMSPLMERALSTIAPGGVCERVAPLEVDALQEDLVGFARAGYEAGLRSRDEHATDRPDRRGDRPTVVIVGSGRFPDRQVASSLVDLGYRVAGQLPAPGPADGEVAIVDLSALAPEPRADGCLHGERPAPADVRHRIAVVPADGDAATDGTTLWIGDLYGPGMPLDVPLADFITRALMRQPIVTEDDPAYVLHPLHLDDLTAALDDLMSDRAVDGCVRLAAAPLALRDLATLVSRTVRPVAVLEAVAPSARTTPRVTPRGGAVAPSARTTPRVTSRGGAAQRCRVLSPAVPLPDGIRGLAQWIAYEADAALQARAAPGIG